MTTRSERAKDDRRSSSASSRRLRAIKSGGNCGRASDEDYYAIIDGGVGVKRNDYIFIICTLDYHYCGPLSFYFLVATSELSLPGSLY